MGAMPFFTKVSAAKIPAGPMPIISGFNLLEFPKPFSRINWNCFSSGFDLFICHLGWLDSIFLISESDKLISTVIK